MSEQYCLLLPADTPLFAHVRYAAKYLFEGTHAEGVELKVSTPLTYGTGTVAPNDGHVMQQVISGSYQDEAHNVYKVLGGICDPGPPVENRKELKIVAAVVKRLGFLLLFPHGWELSWDKLVASTISSIWAHGAYKSGSNEQEDRPSSSAQALSRNIWSWKGESPDISLKGGAITHVPIPTEHNGAVDIVITTNYSEAFKLANSEKAVTVPAPNVFPEWSHLLLSALLTRQCLTAKEHNIIAAVVIAINKACHSIHYEHRSDSFAKTLMDLYPHVFENEPKEIASDVSRLLIDDGFIPQNIVTSRLGQFLGYCMWYGLLPRAVIDAPGRQILVAADQPQLGEDSPICDHEFARSAYASSLSENIERRLEKGAKVIIPLHGILTHGQWHRRIADIAGQYDWKCRLDRWYYGVYSVLRVLFGISRDAQVRWFVKTYYEEKEELPGRFCPCVIAHSFGTYIVGYALLLYQDLRFDRIILCGSILPTDYPWKKLIELGRVQAVLNQHSRRDCVARFAGCFVSGAGPSGCVGFVGENTDVIINQKCELNGHRGYFKKYNMQEQWVTFLNRGMKKGDGELEARESELILYTKQKKNIPVGLVIVLLLIALMAGYILFL